MIKLQKKTKDFLLFIRIFTLLKPVSNLLKTLSNFSLLSQWISRVDKKSLIINDFYTPSRNYNKRYTLYETIGNYFNLKEAKINYLEFGVASASSFKWWIDYNSSNEAHFYGFDTFEGLPEKWGHYKKGQMSYGIPDIPDKRAEFFKGLFQETLNPFLNTNEKDLQICRTVVHLDADLFTATLFALSQLYRHLKQGDLIFFDEFNVPNHEFSAYKMFTDVFGMKLKPIGTVNNFYQTAFIVEE